MAAWRNFILTCEPATRLTGQAKRGLEGIPGEPLIGHKFDTGWQGRLTQTGVKK